MTEKRCSTPEGIGSGTTFVVEFQLVPLVVCSTPEGIGSGTTGFDRLLGRTSHVLNARRHRKRNNLITPLESSDSDVCSTPEGIGSGTTTTRPATVDPQFVLNARRHRKRNNWSNTVWTFTVQFLCSTSEGIGSGTTGRKGAIALAVYLCSTPEGIGSGTTLITPPGGVVLDRAQRPKASEAEQHPKRQEIVACIKECSTPEGIGSGTTTATALGQEDPRMVLNARRHRKRNNP